jgi:hypothetical protein
VCSLHKLCLFLLYFQLVSASNPPTFPRQSFLGPSSTVQRHHGVQIASIQTPAPHFDRRNNSTNLNAILKLRATTPETSTCGYYNGDPTKPRTANEGYDCRIDSTHGLWGFCPTTVIAAVDCGLAAACVDEAACSNGCGVRGQPTMTTFTW